jgi:AraC-like DNA-binding protein
MKNRAIQYREYIPTAALQGYVDCYWTGTPDPGVPDADGIHRVLPDGCIDIVVEFDVCAGEDGEHIVPGFADKAAVVGTMSRPLIVNSARRTCFLGTRFRPGMAIALLGGSAGELTDQSIRIGEVWSQNAGGDFEDRLTDQPTITAKIRLVEGVLLEKLGRKKDDDPYVGPLVDLIVRERGGVSVEALSEFAGISRQHIARKFDRYVGISPKLFSRVMRFQDLMTTIRGARNIDWASTALDLGYYDQAHMISDFKEFSGQTPASFLID